MVSLPEEDMSPSSPFCQSVRRLLSDRSASICSLCPPSSFCSSLITGVPMMSMACCVLLTSCNETGITGTCSDAFFLACLAKLLRNSAIVASVTQSRTQY